MLYNIYISLTNACSKFQHKICNFALKKKKNKNTKKGKVLQKFSTRFARAPFNMQQLSLNVQQNSAKNEITTTTATTREANKTWKINSKTNEKTRKVLPAHLNRAVQCTLCVLVCMCVLALRRNSATMLHHFHCHSHSRLPSLCCAATALCPPQRRDFKRRGTSTFCMPR